MTFVGRRCGVAPKRSKKGSYTRSAPGYQHNLTGDSRLLERFISTLGLTDVTLFSHDVTGSIAWGVVARRPEWFSAVVVLPSFAWPLESYRKVYPMIQLIGSPMFRFL